MLKHLAIAAIISTLIISCTKGVDGPITQTSKTQDTTTIATHDTTTGSPQATNDFVKYTIPQGAQYCDKNAYTAVSYEQLSFVVKFDSSAIYRTASDTNQHDINKLFGFSDNNAQHHLFSARFGWRWSENALRLFAYVYNNGAMIETEIGIVKIGVENNCSIKVMASKYVFKLNGTTLEMPRTSTTTKAEGYKLYPYFGGTEMAPHTISIWIKENK